MKMKDLSFEQKISTFFVAGVFFTLMNYTLTVYRENTRLENMVRLEEMRSEVNNEMVDELLWSKVNDIHNLTKDQLIGQGRLEGVVSYLSGGNQDIIDNLWHEGYARGLSQNEYEYDIISKNEYEKGYHSAMQDISEGESHPDFVPRKEIQFVNESPRELIPNAIKKPSFDSNVELPDTEKEIGLLNIKIEDFFNPPK